MPASRRSLQITSSYRSRLGAIGDRVERQVRIGWPVAMDDLDDSWSERTAALLAQAQTEAVRVSAGYLTAFLTAELGKPARGPSLASGDFAGFFSDGRPLGDAMRSPVIASLAARNEGASDEVALEAGYNRARRMAEAALMAAARNSLLVGIDADERIRGWQRGLAGTCGACMGDVAVETRIQLPSVPLRIHPYCKCVTVPVVVGARNLWPLPTGKQTFDGMSSDDQDAQFGPEKAEQLRSGAIALEDLVEEAPLKTDQADLITETPMKRLS